MFLFRLPEKVELRRSNEILARYKSGRMKLYSDALGHRRRRRLSSLSKKNAQVDVFFLFFFFFFLRLTELRDSSVVARAWKGIK